jgi:hypothetical protein
MKKRIKLNCTPEGIDHQHRLRQQLEVVRDLSNGGCGEPLVHLGGIRELKGVNRLMKQFNYKSNPKYLLQKRH